MTERSFSHAALVVGRGEGPLASRLLSHLGFDVRDNGPSATGEHWYTAVIDPATYAGFLDHLGFFVLPASDAQLTLESALPAEAVAALAAEKLRRPDSNPHLALRYARLDDLEAAVRGLRDDPELSFRTEIVRTRPQAAPTELEERLDRSDVFADATRVRYLTAGVQAFVLTDVVGAGLLRVGQSFELNHETEPGGWG